MTETLAPITPAIGWGVLHLFCRPTPFAEAEAITSAVKDCQAAGHIVLHAAILGHKADLCVMALGPDLRVLRRLQTNLQQAGLDVVDSYVSLTEVSEYAKGMPQEMLDLRLYPPLPVEGKPAFCFYPMGKRRNVDQNWFTLPYEDRERLMREHGTSGRKFAGRVTQVVTGSAGFDDFEWGVTLFAQRPDDLKEVVYTMRFDEASAVFAEFGPFYVGYLVDLEELVAPYR